jgi:phage N-6-adenine-methyltransferase
MKKINSGLFTSNSSEWETPQDFFDELNKIWQFTTDVCASKENHKCNNYFTKETNGLTQPWSGVCWMNPPYGREIGEWTKKAFESSVNATVVGLLPARTDTKWFHDYIYSPQLDTIHQSMIFVRGRLTFVGAKNSAPFPSMIVVWYNSSSGRLALERVFDCLDESRFFLTAHRTSKKVSNNS